MAESNFEYTDGEDPNLEIYSSDSSEIFRICSSYDKFNVSIFNKMMSVLESFKEYKYISTTFFIREGGMGIGCENKILCLFVKLFPDRSKYSISILPKTEEGEKLTAEEGEDWLALLTRILCYCDDGSLTSIIQMEISDKTISDLKQIMEKGYEWKAPPGSGYSRSTRIYLSVSDSEEDSVGL
jgi:hypothetical protein